MLNILSLKHRASKKTKGHSQKGVGLIEVMIAVLILAVGLLGILTLQKNALKLNQVSYYYSQASVMISDITEKVRSNLAASDQYQLVAGNVPATAGDCIANPCNPDQLAQWQLAQWRERVAQIFPKGDAEIEIANDVNDPSFVAITFTVDDNTQRIQVDFRL